MRITQQQILDYIQEGDFEQEIEKMAFKKIQRVLEDQGYQANYADIMSAVFQAKERPLVRA